MANKMIAGETRSIQFVLRLTGKTDWKKNKNVGLWILLYSPNAPS